MKSYIVTVTPKNNAQPFCMVIHAPNARIAALSAKRQMWHNGHRINAFTFAANLI